MDIQDTVPTSPALPSLLVIARLYSAIATRDLATVDACYAPNATFHDGMFGSLDRPEIVGMWRHLFSTLLAEATVEIVDVSSLQTEGRLVWSADYTFPVSGRRVKNIIEAHLCVEGGLISSHREQFDMTRWTQQALGLDAVAAAAPQTHARIRHQARSQLLSGIAP